MINKNKEVTDLIITEDDLLTFDIPDIKQVQAAYSKKFRTTPANEIKHINDIFPKKSVIKDEVPGYSIDDQDPII